MPVTILSSCAAAHAPTIPRSRGAGAPHGLAERVLDSIAAGANGLRFYHAGLASDADLRRLAHMVRTVREGVSS